MIELTLPMCPSINHYKRVGRTVITRAGKRYQQKVNSPETNLFYDQVNLIIRAKIANGEIKPFLDSKVALSCEIDLYQSDNRSDIDNRVKPILDALQRSGLIANDRQIAKLLVTRMNIVKGGQIVVRISNLTM